MPGLASPTHLILLLLIALLLFGAKRLPEIGRSLGSGMREFKDSVSHDQQEPHQHLLASTEPLPTTVHEHERDAV
jgi:sec-independent protein translocase protein TatA